MDRIERISGYLAGIATLMIGVAILAQIALRPLGIYLPGTVELATYSMIAAVFLGLPYTFATRGHIRVTLLVQRVPTRRRKPLEMTSRLIALLWLAYMDYWLIDLVLRSFNKKAMTSGLIVLPLWIPQALIAVGVTLMVLSVLKSLVVLARNREDLATIYNEPDVV